MYTINGFKILVLGSALSTDKDSRKPNVTWWEREYWSEEEKRDVFRLLENEKVFDCVVSHTGPHRINKLLFENIKSDNSRKFMDEVAFMNDNIEKRIQFREWWCGHWHMNRYYRDEKTGRGFQYLYKSTEILDHQDNGIVVHNEFGMLNR